jgi:hypothetical protein
MSDMLTRNPTMYKSIWTRETLLSLLFGDQKIAHVWVVAVEAKESKMVQDFENWTAFSAKEFALPFVERSLVSKTVCLLVYTFIYLFIICTGYAVFD